MIKHPLKGSVEIDPNELNKGTWSTFTLKYTVGKEGIAIGGGIRIGFEWVILMAVNSGLIIP